MRHVKTEMLFGMGVNRYLMMETSRDAPLKATRIWSVKGSPRDRRAQGLVEELATTGSVTIIWQSLKDYEDGQLPLEGSRSLLFT